MSAIKRKVAPKRSKISESKLGIFLQIKLLLMLLCVGIFFYAYSNWESWLEKLDNKPISAFVLLGSPQYTTNSDVRDLVLKMGIKGFFAQDVDIVREQIQSMPWVKGAIVRKIWPDKLSISVSEYSPVAFWNSDEFLASDGTVFKLPADKLKDPNLPHLFGPDYQGLVVLNAWNQMFQELKAKGMGLKAVAVDERGSWEIILDNEITLKLGRGEWKSKIDRFVTVYPQIEVPENKRISYVDLRYKVGAAIGFSDLN